MLRTALIAGVIATATLSAPVLAADAKVMSTAETTIGDLLANPDAKAIVDKYMPGFSANPQVEMAKSMTFKQIQQFAPDQIKDELLAKIDADLTKIPAK